MLSLSQPILIRFRKLLTYAKLQVSSLNQIQKCENRIRNVKKISSGGILKTPKVILFDYLLLYISINPGVFKSLNLFHNVIGKQIGKSCINKRNFSTRRMVILKNFVCTAESYTLYSQYQMNNGQGVFIYYVTLSSSL